MFMRHAIGAVGIVLLATTTLASCGEDAETAGTTTTQAEISTADTDLGTILVDHEGRALYVFTEDRAGVSNCQGECLDLWPPLAGEVAAGEGVDASLIGTIERDDGTTQATYADAPLYHYAQDARAGETSGQGVNGSWFVVGVDGEPITEEVPSPPDGRVY